MEYVTVTEHDLKAIAREIDRLFDADARFTYSAGGQSTPFVLVEFGRGYQHHFRLDLLPFENGRFQTMIGSSYNAPYSYRVTSLHIKRLRDLESGKFAVYTYLNYMGGGVWQPLWGYTRELLERGKVGRRLSLTDKEMSDAYLDCHDMMAAMTKALNSTHALACGPLRAPDTAFASVGLQGTGLPQW